MPAEPEPVCRLGGIEGQEVNYFARVTPLFRLRDPNKQRRRAWFYIQMVIRPQPFKPAISLEIYYMQLKKIGCKLIVST